MVRLQGLRARHAVHRRVVHRIDGDREALPGDRQIDAVADLEAERGRGGLAAVVAVAQVAGIDVGLRERAAEPERGAAVEQQRADRGRRGDGVDDVRGRLLGVVVVEQVRRDGRARALVDGEAGVGRLHRRAVLDLVGADIDRAAHHARLAARIERQILGPVAVAVEVLGIRRKLAIVAGVERGAAGLDRDRLDRPAIVGEHAGVELVAVDRRRIERCDGGEDVGEVASR